ncbi:unnamed protein product [Rotaria magnacalcarata]|uniref:G-protein coupled receptors family 1 profile domain-containing protein n=1 Tax=Rotaria magnacalcarata TaxID=392030 RepID=A0A815XRK0_9BILA|nr:unnamed protein product [Rotaria magnacalcarata]
MTIYLGLFILVIDFFGGILNIIVFLSLQTFRQNSCSFYLAAMSFVNITHLTNSLPTHVFIFGFGIDLTGSALFYCKIRFFLIELWLLTSFTCMCFATVDQFLATSFSPFWHRWNHAKVTRCIVIGTILFWILHEIPFVIYYDLIPSPLNINQTICAETNITFQQYVTCGYICILMGALPLIVMVLFGLLAYYNVRNLSYRTVPLVRHELVKQLTQMVLIQVIHNVFVLTPFVILTLIVVTYQYNEPTSSFQMLAIDIHNFHFAVSRQDISYYIYFYFNSYMFESILYIHVCIKTISSTVYSCIL